MCRGRRRGGEEDEVGRGGVVENENPTSGRVGNISDNTYLLCMHMYARICIYMRACARMCRQMRAYACICINMRSDARICTQVRAHACIWIQKIKI